MRGWRVISVLFFIFVVFVPPFRFGRVYEVFVFDDVVVLFYFLIDPLHDFIAVGCGLSVDGC